MSYVLVVDQPNLGDEGEILIHGLGTFKNGEHSISDEQAQQFRVTNSRTMTATPNDQDDTPEEERGRWVQVTGTVLGSDLPTAAETMYGITVKHVEDTSGADDKRPVDSEAKPQTAPKGGE